MFLSALAHKKVNAPSVESWCAVTGGLERVDGVADYSDVRSGLTPLGESSRVPPRLRGRDETETVALAGALHRRHPVPAPPTATWGELLSLAV